ncbi:long-chain fatty acid--CoA ligase [bacterium]|nr:long-chain fatty acid--CoA ligase [bacterium]
MDYNKYSHFIPLFFDRCQEEGNNICFKYFENEWKELTWKEVKSHVLSLASWLKKNVKEGDNIGIYSSNRWEWIVSNLAIQTIKCSPVPIHNTCSEEDLVHIIKETEMKTIFISGNKEFNIIKNSEISNFNSDFSLIYFDSIEIENNQIISQENGLDNWSYTQFSTLLNEKYNESDFSNFDENDIFGIIYTSGTTGEPKGAILTQKNMIFQIKNHEEVVPGLAYKNHSFSVLPLSHVFELGWIHMTMAKGMINYFGPSGPEIVKLFPEAEPNIICIVPRVLEKVYEKVQEELSKKSIFVKLIFKFALLLSLLKTHRGFYGRKQIFGLRTITDLLQNRVLGKIKDIFGKKIETLVVGGAKLSIPIERFFEATGIKIELGYGLTETCATVSCFRFPGTLPGSVGQAVPGVEIKIGENSEILVKGDNIFSGYYKKPEETAKIFTSDGFLKTGDAGFIDNNGNITVTERIKNLIKTSSGKYVAPQKLESRLETIPFIEQITIIGDAKKYISALIVPSFNKLEEYAKTKGIIFNNYSELIQNSEIVQFYRKKIDEALNGLPNFEQIRKFTLLSNLFTIEGGELTPTLKIKREFIMRKYNKIISLMYE